MYNAYQLPTHRSTMKNIIFKKIYNSYAVSELFYNLINKYGNEKEPISIENFDAALDRYWFNSGDFDYLTIVFRPYILQLLIIKLLNDKPINSGLEFIDSTFYDIGEIKKIIDDIHKENNPFIYMKSDDTIDKILSYLLLTGYLTVDYETMAKENESHDLENIFKPSLEITKRKFKVKIPNQEIKNGLITVLNNLLNDLARIYISAFNVCSIKLNELLRLEKECLGNTINIAFTNFLYFMHSKEKTKSPKEEMSDGGIHYNEDLIHSFLNVVVPNSEKIFSASEYPHDKKRSDVLYFSLETGRLVIIEIKYNRDLPSGEDQVESYLNYAMEKENDVKDALVIIVNYVTKDKNNDLEQKDHYIDYAYKFVTREEYESKIRVSDKGSQMINTDLDESREPSKRFEDSKKENDESKKVKKKALEGYTIGKAVKDIKFIKKFDNEQLSNK